MSSTKQDPICLGIHGLGHVPSFKNSKMIITRPRVRLMTKPEYQKWMKKCEDTLLSQLHSLYRIFEEGTPMARSPRSWIASYVPLDDSVNHIRKIQVEVKAVDKGEEGAVLLIECYKTEVIGNQRPGEPEPRTDSK